MKKILSLVLACLMLLGCCSAVAENSNFNADGEFPLFKEKETLTIAVPQLANLIDWNTCEMTLKYEDMCNVELEFIEYPYSEYITQLTLAITSGDELPDIIMFQWAYPSLELVYEWAMAGAIIPLNDLIDEYGYWLKESFETTGVEFLTYVTCTDGNVYTLPVYNQSLTNEALGKIWLYKPWLDKLELKVPTTVEEMYEVLKAFKEKDPNGNGEADEIPVLNGSWFEALMTPFQYVPNGNLYFVEDGKVNLYFMTEEWREGMKYIRKLFDEGLIDPLTFTVDSTQAKALYMSETPVVGASFGHVPGATALTDRMTEFVGIAPLLTTEGEKLTTFAPSMPNPNALITADCKNPEAAMRFLDICYREQHTISIQWGNQDQHWRYAEEGEECAYAYMGYKASFKELETIFGTVQNVFWYSAGPHARPYRIASGRILSMQPGSTGAMPVPIQGAYSEAYPDEDIYIPKLIFTAEENEQVTDILADIANYYQTARANFCLNRDGFDINDDAAYEKFLDEFEKIGWSKVQPIIQQVYDRMYKAE